LWLHLKQICDRFCQECIVTALRSGNKECPTCRKKLVSKRSLRPDPNFDALINKIYPNRDDYNAHQEHVLAARLRHSANPGAVLAQRLAIMLTHVNQSPKWHLDWFSWFCTAPLCDKHTGHAMCNIYTNSHICAPCAGDAA